MHRDQRLARTLSSALITGVLAAAVAAAQAPTPPPQPGTPAGAQKAAPPSGIQTLPIPSAKDSVKPDDVILSVGANKITRAQFEQLRRSLPPQYAQAAQQMDDRNFANTIALYQSLAQYAEREKLDNSAQFKDQMTFLRMELLAQAALNQLRVDSQVINEAEVKAYYEANLGDFQQARVKALFVSTAPPARPAPAPPAGAEAPKPETPKARTDEEARARTLELRKQILDGAEFAAIAKANSDDLRTGEKGGDFGNIRKNQLNANLQKAIFSLKPKEVSEPVKEGQGYYLFMVEEIRPVTLDEATATINNVIQQQKFSASMEKLQKKDFPAVFNDKFFSEPAAQAPAGGAGRPVITGVAPAQPGAVAPPPAAKPATPPAAKPR